MAVTAMESTQSAAGKTQARKRRLAHVDLTARGEPGTWLLGGALSFGILMVVGFLALVLWQGLVTMWPQPIVRLTLNDGHVVAGEPIRTETYRPDADALTKMSASQRAQIAAAGGLARRTLYKVGNFDLYGDDFLWVTDADVKSAAADKDMLLAERLEWGQFIGRIGEASIGGEVRRDVAVGDAWFQAGLDAARTRWKAMRKLERDGLGGINHKIDQARLDLRAIGLKKGVDSPAYAEAKARLDRLAVDLKGDYDKIAAEVATLRAADQADTITLVDVGGKAKTQVLSGIVRIYPANDLSLPAKVGVYLSRWWEYLSEEPREANTEGGVLPAIFGTVAMTLLLSIFVAPFGVMTALYLREYAKQGAMVSIVRISVNNLAGVPSIVYGVFGLGFFAYILGGNIDQLFFPERLPNPTFGTGGLLWASLTLALMTVPVVIVATEEALSAVPRSMREGSLACGASKWQTIRLIVLPRAMPGILTGLILAMARGAGEVAPLMLVGVVKLAPELPIDGTFPFVHLERSFMHLGFHIYDVGFQSRNSEAGKPMVFVTTLVLVALIAVMNATAIVIRNRLKRKFAGSQF